MEVGIGKHRHVGAPRFERVSELQEGVDGAVSAHAEVDDFVFGKLLLEYPGVGLLIVEAPPVGQRAAENPDLSLSARPSVRVERMGDSKRVGQVRDVKRVACGQGDREAARNM